MVIKEKMAFLSSPLDALKTDKKRRKIEEPFFAPKKEPQKSGS